ncbi:MAG: nicotinate-nucleotide--dimethylbenzimidazole phosphoribosyltransferase [Bacillota bacterium]
MFDLQVKLHQIKPLDRAIMEETQVHLDDLTKPPGSLGVMEEIARCIAGITGKVKPQIRRKTSILMAADHGVVDEGVSAYPSVVTAQMVLNFLNGGAAINVLSRHVGAELAVMDVGVASDLPDHPSLWKKKVAYGTRNMVREAAMTRAQALEAIKNGYDLAEHFINGGTELIGTGEMGIGNTTASTALLVHFAGVPVNDVVGRGTGIDDERLKLKIKAIEAALQHHKPPLDDPLEALARIGGLEIAGLVGVFLACAVKRVPAIVDGFISAAAALVASRLHPHLRDYLLASHLSEEPGHRLMLELIGIRPVLHMKMRLGEGTGAALAMNIIEASLKILNEMATFSSAGVSGTLEDGGVTQSP